jgi:sec-independent protein translocase protein TatA
MRATPRLSATHYIGTQEFRIFSNSMEAFVGEGLFQPMHLMVIFFIALPVFGPRKLPELGRGLGDGIRELKKGLQDASSANSTSADPKSSDTKKV